MLRIMSWLGDGTFEGRHVVALAFHRSTSSEIDGTTSRSRYQEDRIEASGDLGK